MPLPCERAGQGTDRGEPAGADGNVILETSDFGSTYAIPVGQLAELFADVEPTYDDLVTHDEAHDLGYRQYIDAWRERGILD